MPRLVLRLRLVVVGLPRTQARLSLLPAAQEHILRQDDGKNRPPGPSKSCPRPSPSPSPTTGRSRCRMTSPSSRPCAPSSPKGRRARARRRGSRPCHPPDHLARHPVRRSHRHLRRPRASRSRTSPSSPTNSWLKSAACPRRIWLSSSCASCCWVRSRPAGTQNLVQALLDSPRCSKRPFAATRTGPSRAPR